jgi:hypothetical protein
MGRSPNYGRNSNILSPHNNRQERTGKAVHYNGSLLYLQSDKISIGPYGNFLLLFELFL